MANITIAAPLIDSINGAMSKSCLRIWDYVDIFNFDTANSIPSGCTLSPATNGFIIANDPIVSNNRSCLLFNYTGGSIKDVSATFVVSNSTQQSLFMDLYYYIWVDEGHMQVSVDDVVYLEPYGDYWTATNYPIVNLEPGWNIPNKITEKTWYRFIIPNLSAGTHTIKIRYYTTWTGTDEDVLGISRIGKVNEKINFENATELRPVKTIVSATSIPANAISSLLVKKDLAGTTPSASASMKNYYIKKIITSNIKPSTITATLNVIKATGATQVINAIQPRANIQTIGTNAFSPRVVGNALAKVTEKTHPIQSIFNAPRLIKNYKFYVYDVKDITPSSCRVTVVLDKIGEYEVEEFGIVYTFGNRLRTDNTIHPIPLYDTLTGIYSLNLTQLSSDKDYLISTYIKRKGDSQIYFNETDKVRIHTPKREGISLCLSNITNNSFDFNIEDIPTGLFGPYDFPLKVYMQVKNFIGEEVFFEAYPYTMYTSSIFEEGVTVTLPANTSSDKENSIYCEIRTNNDQTKWKHYSTFIIPTNSIDIEEPKLRLTYCWNKYVQLSWDPIEDASFYRVEVITNNNADITFYDVPGSQLSIELYNITGYSRFNVRACNSKYSTKPSNMIEYTPKAFFPTPVTRIRYENGHYELYWTNNGTSQYEIICILNDGRVLRNEVEDETNFTISTELFYKLKSIAVRGYETNSQGEMTGRYSDFSQPIYV